MATSIRREVIGTIRGESKRVEELVEVPEPTASAISLDLATSKSKFDDAATVLSTDIEDFDGFLRKWPHPIDWSAEFTVDGNRYELRYELFEGARRLVVEGESAGKKPLTSCKVATKLGAVGAFPRLVESLREHMQTMAAEIERVRASTKPYLRELSEAIQSRGGGAR